MSEVSQWPSSRTSSSRSRRLRETGLALGTPIGAGAGRRDDHAGAGLLERHHSSPLHRALGDRAVALQRADEPVGRGGVAILEGTGGAGGDAGQVGPGRLVRDVDEGGGLAAGGVQHGGVPQLVGRRLGPRVPGLGDLHALRRRRRPRAGRTAPPARWSTVPGSRSSRHGRSSWRRGPLIGAPRMGDCADRPGPRPPRRARTGGCRPPASLGRAAGRSAAGGAGLSVRGRQRRRSGPAGPGRHGCRAHRGLGGAPDARARLGRAAARRAGDDLHGARGGVPRPGRDHAGVGTAARAVLLLRVLRDDPLPLPRRPGDHRRALRHRRGLHRRGLGLRLRLRRLPGGVAGLLRRLRRRDDPHVLRAAVPVLHQPHERRPLRHRAGPATTPVRW